MYIVVYVLSNQSDKIKPMSNINATKNWWNDAPKYIGFCMHTYNCVWFYTFSLEIYMHRSISIRIVRIGCDSTWNCCQHDPFYATQCKLNKNVKSTTKKQPNKKWNEMI